MSDVPKHATKDRLSPQRMQQLVERPMSVLSDSGLGAAEKEFDTLLEAALEEHGSQSVAEADLLTSFGVQLFLADPSGDDCTLRQASVEYLKRAIPAYRGAFGSNHPEVAVALNSYADAILQVEGEGARPDAYAALEEAYSIRLAALGPENAETRSTAVRLGKEDGPFASGENLHSSSPDRMYLDLRQLALRTEADDIGVSTSGSRDAYGIVMDMDVSGRTATITSFATGDASLYLSTGGGTIGSGQASKEVAAAAKQFVFLAKICIHGMEKAPTQPLPESGEVRFYVIASDGIYGAAAPKQVLADNIDNFSGLYYAGQAVLTQIRLNEEQNSRHSQQRD